MLQLQREGAYSQKLSKTQGHPKVPSNSGGLVKGAERGGVRVTEERGFLEQPGVKCMSSSPMVSVNYFSPLNIEESTEIESMLDSPQNAEKRVGAVDADVPVEGTAEWVLWMMHQNPKEGESVLGDWTHIGRKSEVMQETIQAILGMDKGKGLEAVKEMRGRKQWIRRINNASVMMSTVVETLTDKRGFAVEALLDCGAMGCYINYGFVTAKNLPTEQLPRPVPVYNADGTHNEGGPITHTATL